MFGRVFVRVVGGLLSFVSVFAGHRGAAAGDVVMTSAPNNGENILVNISSGSPTLGWSCVPLKSGKNGSITCTDGSDSSGVVGSDKDNLYKYVDSSGDYNNCGPVKHDGNNANPRGAWTCFCNATGLCAPTAYLTGKKFDVYSSGTADGGVYYPYKDGTCYSMEQWYAGITDVTVASGETGVLYGGNKSGWGEILVSADDSTPAHGLKYPVETVYVRWTGCADGSYASTAGVSGISLTMTALMRNTAYLDSYLYGMLQYGTPVYSVASGAVAYSGITGWTCPFYCINESVVFPDGVTHNGDNATTNGFNECVTAATGKNNTGSFEVECKGAASSGG